MNQNIQNWIIEQASNVTNWANAEVPLVIQEFLIWNFYSGLINIVGILVFLGIVFSLCIKFKKNIIETFKYDDFLTAVISIITIFCAIFSTVGLFSNVKDIIQIKVAPKVYLVEKAAELIKQK